MRGSRFTPESILVSGRAAIVTGAAAGIGEATAAALARFGARLAVCDRDERALAECAARMEEQGTEVIAEALDVRDAEAARRFVSAAARRFGGIDILVNNAGGTFYASHHDLSAKGEATLIAENFTQVSGLIRIVAEHMAGGAIVNITSIEAHQAAPGFAVYAAMKAAVESLTRSLALELAPRSIRVNAVAPDALPTRGETAAAGQMLAGGAAYDPATLPPLGHRGEPEDAAGAVLYLVSDLARFVTGTTIHVDGGMRAAGGWRRR
ncbi:MAG: SDR family NAD(P)-dependent oxidoreductase [Micromonosporaceae bacterium]